MALRAASPPPASKFGVYENAAVASALSHQTIRRRPWHFPFVLMLSCGSFSAVWSIFSRVESLADNLATLGFSQGVAAAFVQAALWAAVIVFFMTLSALCKVLSLSSTPDTHLGMNIRAVGNTTLIGSPVSSFVSPGSTGLKTLKARGSPLDFSGVPRQRPPRARQSPGQSQSPALVPIHPSVLKSKPLSSPWAGLSGFAGPVKSPAQNSCASSGLSGSPYQVTPFPAPPVPSAAPVSQLQSSPGSLTFWPNHRTRSGRLDFGKDEIDSEKKLEEFLAEVDDKLADVSGKPLAGQATPSPIVQGVTSVPTPSPVPTPTSITGTPRTPMRALRMSPTAPKTGSPKKGEMEIPLPMSIEQAVEVFKKLGIYPQIEQWRDSLRQWFSEMLLNPLVRKIESSHCQAMAAATQLGLTINVAKVGGSKQDPASVPVSPDGSQQEWLTTMVPDEDSQLHQLRAQLLQARDGPVSVHNSLFGLAPPQEKVYNPQIQACLDAVTEHQRLKALMKGEWVKGLLLQNSVRADYTVQRIQDLAEGTCVKAYDYMPNGEVYDKVSKRWTTDLPSDAHLLLYLFCALLEHPQWMLHVDPTSYPSTQSGNNSLFVASLPHKERYPEKYIAIISGAPSVLHAGATILAVSRTSPPVFALYWDKKLQFSFQGRSALWDAILLLCYRVKIAHGGVVRGINLASPAFNLHAVLEPSPESPVK